MWNCVAEIPMAFDVCVVGGAGHAGLPLALALARTGLLVAICDVNEAALQELHAGRMPFVEEGALPVLRSVLNQTFFIAHALSVVEAAQTVIIAVGTPVNEFLSPDLSVMHDLLVNLRPHLNEKQTVIIRSTVYPMTCRQIAVSLGAGTIGNIAYCPERTVQGKAMEELVRLPQIISGLTEHAVTEADRLFARLTSHRPRVSVEAAELAKLCNNAWRYIQFAAVNEFYKMACDSNVDFNEVHTAMVSGYSRAVDMPGPGFAAGPCLPKDTLQLAAFAGNGFPLGRSAFYANEELPDFLVASLARQRDLTRTCAGILGMAFKAEIDDNRGSLAYKLARLLRFRGATVLCSDEFIVDAEFVTKEELIARCDVIIVGAPHRSYRQLQIPDSIETIDLWNVLLHSSNEHPHLTGMG